MALKNHKYRIKTISKEKTVKTKQNKEMTDRNLKSTTINTLKLKK
jgi:hypothetical protein